MDHALVVALWCTRQTPPPAARWFTRAGSAPPPWRSSSHSDVREVVTTGSRARARRPPCPGFGRGTCRPSPRRPRSDDGRSRRRPALGDVVPEEERGGEVLDAAGGEEQRALAVHVDLVAREGPGVLANMPAVPPDRSQDSSQTQNVEPSRIVSTARGTGRGACGREHGRTEGSSGGRAPPRGEPRVGRLRVGLRGRHRVGRGRGIGKIGCRRRLGHVAAHTLVVPRRDDPETRSRG